MSKYIKLDDALEIIDKNFDNIPLEQTVEILRVRRQIREETPTIEIGDEMQYIKLEDATRNMSGLVKKLVDVDEQTAREAVRDSLCVEPTIEASEDFISRKEFIEDWEFRESR